MARCTGESGRYVRPRGHRAGVPLLQDGQLLGPLVQRSSGASLLAPSAPPPLATTEDWGESQRSCCTILHMPSGSAVTSAMPRHPLSRYLVLPRSRVHGSTNQRVRSQGWITSGSRGKPHSRLHRDAVTGPVHPSQVFAGGEKGGLRRTRRCKIK